MAHTTVTSTSAVPQTEVRQRAEQALNTEAREHGQQQGACLVFRDCTETEPGHYDHHAHDLKVTEDDGVTPVLTAGMVALSDSDHGAIVYLRNAEFEDTASVHAKTAEIRRMLDEVDAMAARVFDDHQARA